MAKLTHRLADADILHSHKKRPPQLADKAPKTLRFADRRPAHRSDHDVQPRTAIAGLVKLQLPLDQRPTTPTLSSRVAASLAHKARVRRALAAGADAAVAREMADAVWRKCWLELQGDELVCRTSKPLTQGVPPGVLDVAPSVIMWCARVSSVHRVRDPDTDVENTPPLVGKEERALVIAVDDDGLQDESGASEKCYRSVLIKLASTLEAQKWFASITRVLQAYRFEAHFKLGQPIGKGHQARVFSAVQRATGAEVACKRMGLGCADDSNVELSSSTSSDRIRWASSERRLHAFTHSQTLTGTDSMSGARRAKRLAAANNEVSMLRRVNHPGVPRALDMYFSAAHAWIVLQKVPGVTLTKYLRTRKAADEMISRRIFRELLLIVQHLHDVPRVLHRDIKGDNIMVHFPPDRPEMPQVFLLDFAHASPISDESSDVKLVASSGYLAMATTVVGTPHFCAPEIIRQARYSTKAECWSLGVVLFSLLVSRLPFLGDSTSAVFGEVLRGPKFNDPAWLDVTEEGASLTKRLLAMEDKRRMSVDEALRHPFMNNF